VRQATEYGLANVWKRWQRVEPIPHWLFATFRVGFDHAVTP
jgi:hypothetical protein